MLYIKKKMQGKQRESNTHKNHQQLQGWLLQASVWLPERGRSVKVRDLCVGVNEVSGIVPPFFEA